MFVETSLVVFVVEVVIDGVAALSNSEVVIIVVSHMVSDALLLI